MAIKRTYNNVMEFLDSDKNSRKLYFGLHKILFAKEYIKNAILDTKTKTIKKITTTSLD